MYVEQYTISAEELLKNRGENMPCLIEPIFPKVGIAAIAGSSDTGKSTLMRQLCISITSGMDNFLDFKINATNRNALYISTEDQDDAIGTLLNIQNQGLCMPESKFSSFRYLFDTENLLPRLKEILEECPHDLIVIDAFADIFTRDINQTNQVRTFLNEYSQLAQRHKCLIIFVHHTGKSSENKSPNKNSLLGSQGFEAKMRTVAFLSKHKTISNFRYFSLVKGNYLPEKFKNESIELMFDENMTFSRTGNLELTENLSKDESVRYQTDGIINLHKGGLSQGVIAKQLGISQPTVSRILKQFNF